MDSNNINFYIDAAKQSAKWHKEHLKSLKKLKFDTIAVHGIYSMQEALDFNQGSIIEPIYMSSSQGYRDPELAIPACIISKVY